jgi:hypothetical protein
VKVRVIEAQHDELDGADRHFFFLSSAPEVASDARSGGAVAHHPMQMKA